MGRIIHPIDFNNLSDESSFEGDRWNYPDLDEKINAKWRERNASRQEKTSTSPPGIADVHQATMDIEDLNFSEDNLHHGGEYTPCYSDQNEFGQWGASESFEALLFPRSEGKEIDEKTRSDVEDVVLLQPGSNKLTSPRDMTDFGTPRSTNQNQKSERLIEVTLGFTLVENTVSATLFLSVLLFAYNVHYCFSFI